MDDGVVAAVVSKCTQLSALNLGSCSKITDAAVVAVAYAAVVAVASGCKQLTSLYLGGCSPRSPMRRKRTP